MQPIRLPLRAVALSLLLLLTPTAGVLQTETAPASAETETAEDPGFLERIIQNALGGDGREVRIVGLEGALSSEVRIAAVEVADGDGTWLEIRDVAMRWRRLAVLRGRIEIEALTIGEVALPRAPIAPPTPAPNLEAKSEEDLEPFTPFALPDMPVSLDLGALAVGRLDLGAPLMGQAAALGINGSALLAGGEGALDLQVVRLDGPKGLITMDGGFDNKTRQLRVDLEVLEAPGGLIATLAQLPGAPSLALTVAGDAPLSDFLARIRLATDGADRLSGTVTIADGAESDPGAQHIGLDLGGDITALFAPDYQEFFGPDVGLSAQIARAPDRGTALEAFALEARALTLTGRARLAPGGLPALIDLSGRIGTEDGLPVTLPLPGAVTTVNNGLLRLSYDAEAGEQFEGDLALLGFRQEALAIETANLAFDGLLQRTQDGAALAELTSAITGTLAGLSLQEPGVDAVLADPITLAAQLNLRPDAGKLALSDLALRSGELGLTGTADLTGLSDGNLQLAAQADLQTGDLPRFAPLVSPGLSGEFDGALEAHFAARTGAFDVTFEGDGTALAMGNPQIDPLLEGPARLALVARRDGSGLVLDRLQLQTDHIAAQGTAQLGTRRAALDLSAALDEAGLLAPHLAGPLTLDLTGGGAGQDYQVALNAAGAALTDILGAPITLTSDITLDDSGSALAISDLALRAGDLRADGAAQVTGLGQSLAATGDLQFASGDLARFEALAGRPMGGQMMADFEGAFDSETKSFDASLKGNAEGVSIGSPQLDQLLAGRTVIDIAAQGSDGKIQIESLSIENPALTLAGGGSLATEQGRFNLEARLQNLGLFLPQMPGPLTLRADGQGSGGQWQLNANAAGPDGLRAAIDGDWALEGFDFGITAGMASLSSLAPGLPGSLALDGAVTGDGTDIFVDLAATSPTGLALDVEGRALGPDGNSDLAITGSLPLALSENFLRPRVLSGTLTADLALLGPPALESLSGTIAIPNGRFADPGNALVLENIRLDLPLANGSAALDLRADLASGGEFLVRGPLALTAPFNSRIAVDLNQLTLLDPRLYEVDLEGNILLDGPLAGAASISGEIEIDRAEIRIPDGFGGGGPIPEMRHLNEPKASRISRDRAGIALDPTPKTDRTAPVAYPLNLVIRAPQQIFVRGRGLDAELGGAIAIRGTSANPIPSGRLSLIRGEMDLLGKVLVFKRAEVSLGGDLVPDLFMVATSQNAEIEANIAISGRLDDPEIEFTSNPELPEDEVLAQLFFGKSVQDLSPLELAQLVGAISTLSGGDGGLMGKLRDQTGVDQLNLGTDSDGNTEVTAGKYLTEDVYTDVTVNAEGTSRIQLNYDISPSLTVRGGFSSDGDTRLGISFERDY